jgi:hypothetical protein
MKAGIVPYGRVYFCHHFTRDLVWRDEWRRHANGVVAVERALIVESDPAAASKIYADMFGSEAVHDIEGGKTLIVGNSRFDILTETALRNQVGADAVPEAQGRKAYMAGLTFRTLSVPKAARYLQQNAITAVQKAGRLVVPAKQAFNAVLEFTE